MTIAVFCTHCCRKQWVPLMAISTKRAPTITCDSCGRRMLTIEEVIEYLLTEAIHHKIDANVVLNLFGILLKRNDEIKFLRDYGGLKLD